MIMILVMMTGKATNLRINIEDAKVIATEASAF